MRRVLWSLMLSAVISTWIICVKFIEPVYLYDSMAIEVDYFNNCYPYKESLDWFKDKVESLGICKKERIYIEKDDCLGPQIYMPSITLEQLFYIEAVKRDSENPLNEHRLTIYLQCIPGRYELGAGPERNNAVIGLTYNTASIALFYPGVRYAERIVLVHELIHVILGEAPDQHCNNEHCIMAPVTGPNNFMLDTPCQNKLNRLLRQRG